MVLVIAAGGLVCLSRKYKRRWKERQQELVILRTLGGAKSKLLTQAVSYEFIVLGALAGLIATLAMEVSIYVLQTQVFNMPASLHWRFLGAWASAWRRSRRLAWLVSVLADAAAKYRGS